MKYLVSIYEGGTRNFMFDTLEEAQTELEKHNKKQTFIHKLISIQFGDTQYYYIENKVCKSISILDKNCNFLTLCKNEKGITKTDIRNAIVEYWKFFEETAI